MSVDAVVRVELVEHDPVWAERFARIRERLQAALGAEAVTIDHFGSTAVPGLRAKPIVDVIVGRAREARFDAWRAKLAALGYPHAREDSTGQDELQWFFRDEPRTTHIHSYPVATRAHRRHLAFRDALRADPALREEYARLKAELAKREWGVVQDYADAKTAFVRRVEGEAMGE